MSIWHYSRDQTNLTRVTDAQRRIIDNCHFCASSLHTIGGSHEAPVDTIGSVDHFRALDVCSSCGWWVVTKKQFERYSEDYERRIRRAWGVLRNLDLSDISAPIDELEAYLTAKFDDRFKLHPRKYEELVGSVFAAAGYQVRVTAYSGDRGIDVFVLDGQGNDVVGVQVKRQRERVEAEQIRSFAGALVLAGVTKGIFVTASTFRKGATETAGDYASRGIGIDLWNAKTFYDRLKLTRRNPYVSADDVTAPYHDAWQQDVDALPLVAVDAGGYDD